MISYEVYKLFHFIGLVLLFTGLFSLLTLKLTNQPLEGRVRKFVFITHGVGLALVLISGFGLLARLGLVQGLPKWVYIKLAAWLFMGVAISLIKRKGQQHFGKLYTIILCVFIVAAYVAINKPFSL